MRRARFLAGLLWTASCGRLGFEGLDGPLAAMPSKLALVATCGAPTDPMEVVIENTGNADLTISGADTAGGFTVTAPFPIVIAPGDQAALSVRAPVPVIGTDRGGDVKNGSLTIHSDDVRRATHEVELTATVLGASVSATGLSGETTLVFDAPGAMCPVGQYVRLRNDGNVAATVESVNATRLGFTPPAPSTVEPGGEITHEVWLLTNVCSGTGQITYQLGGPSCAPPMLALSATYDVTGVPMCRCQTPVSPA